MSDNVIERIFMNAPIESLPTPVLIYGYPNSNPNDISENLRTSIYYKLHNLPRTQSDQLIWENQVDFIIINQEHESIKINAIKELQNRLQMGPKNLSHIVVNILSCEKLTVAAANAFLKTLEEPPCPTIFVLSSAYYEQILPTIRSRCLAFFCKKQNSPKNPEHTEVNSNFLKLKEFISLNNEKKHDWFFNTLKEKSVFADLLSYWLEDLKPFDKALKINIAKFIIEYLKKLEYNINMNLQAACFLAEFIELKIESKEL